MGREVQMTTRSVVSGVSSLPGNVDQEVWADVEAARDVQ